MNKGSRTLSAQSLVKESSTQREVLGAVATTENGSVYVYGKAGASNLSAGKLSVAEAAVANHTNQAVAVAAAAGATQVSLTLGATAATLNQYAEGFLVINDAAGEGNYYKIVGHPAAGSAGTLVVQLEDPIQVALTTSSEYSLVKPRSKDVVESTTLSKAIGVPRASITAAYFGWFQQSGYASVLSDGTPTKGYNVVQSNGTAGAVEVFTDSTAGATDLQEIVGVADETLVSTEYRGITLKIA